MNKVFMVGSPRSGTTLAQSILASHSKIVSSPETQLLSSTIPIFKWRQTLKIYTQNDVDKLNLKMKECGYTGPQVKKPKPFIFSTRKWMRLVMDSMNKLAHALAENKEEIFLEKTPRHLHFIDLINQTDPDTKFIHILRDGLEVVASMENAAAMNTKVWSNRNTEKCIFWWNRSIKLSRKYIGKPKHFFLLYSSLVSDKEKTIKKLCDFIEVPFEPSMLTDFTKTAQQLVKKHEDWKKNNMQQQIARKKPEDLYSKEQIEKIKGALICDVNTLIPSG